MIELTKVNINRYKCIEEEQSFDIEKDITVLVGMNESGKTSILEALAKCNYFTKDNSFTFNMTHDYPRKQKKSVEKRGEIPIAVELTYKADERLIKEISDDCGLKPVSDTFKIIYKYDNSHEWCISWIDTQKFIMKKVKSLQFDSKELIENLGTIDTKSDFDEIIKKIQDSETILELNDEDRKKLNTLTKYFSGVDSWTESQVDNYIIEEFLSKQLPKFMYYDDYYSLPSRVSLTTLDEHPKDSSQKTAKALIELAEIDLNTLTDSEDYEDFIAELEATEAIITEELFKYWTTNQHLNIQFNINKEEASDGYNSKIVDKILEIRVKNQRAGVSLPLENRSKGFNWFFSFLVWFNKIQEDSDTKYILLLDEPGLNLHAKAQGDLLKFLSDLSKNYQIIYTTHSPFMIETNGLSKVRTVYETNDGTKISHSVQEKDPNTLFPLQAALGYDLAQNLFVSKKNLLVEGISDLTYLSIMTNLLQESGREGLDADITIVPIGGADKVATFISLLRGNKLKTVCLLDTFTNQSAKKRLNNMVSKNIIKENKILFYHDILNAEYADIEDLFKKEEYINLFNGAFGLEVDISKTGKGPILKQLNRLIDQNFNHYSPANYFARNVNKIKLTEETLDNFEKLFKKINQLMK